MPKYRRANYFQGYSNFTLNKKILEKISRLWTTHEIFYRTYVVSTCTWQQDV